MKRASLAVVLLGCSASGDKKSEDPRAAFFGDSRCAGAGVAFCDGFEGALDPSWSVLGTAPGLDDSQAARGDGSLHTEIGHGQSALVTSAIFPAPDNTYFGRIFVRFHGLPTAPGWAHWTLVGGSGATLLPDIRVGGQLHPLRGDTFFGVGTDDEVTGDWTWLDTDPSGEARPVPEDEWICLEWEHDGANDEMRVFWDEEEHPSLHATRDSHGGDTANPMLLPEFESVWIGWWLYHDNPTPPVTGVWLDEVALDYARIGCER